MKNSDKIFLFGIILLGLNFLYRLIDAGKWLVYFPLDITNDLSAYVSLLYFFDIYGYLANVPNWYNGFILFNTYPPGWVFFTYPIYKLVNDVILASYISMILMYILGAIGIYLICKEVGIANRIKQVLFFLLVFASPMLVGAILKQGRLPSLLGLVLVVYVLYISLYFKERQIDWKIISLSLLFGMLLISHQAESILAGIFILGLILIKENNDRIKIILALVLGLILSLFWVIPFIKSIMSTDFLSIGFANWVLDFKNYFWSNTAAEVTSIGLFILFYLYYKQNGSMKELLFYLPLLLINFLFASRLVAFIPIIKYVYPDPYQDFFMLFAVLFLLKIDAEKLSGKIRKLVFVMFVLFVIAGVSYNIVKTPYNLEYTQLEYDFLDILDYVDGRYLIVSSERFTTSYSRAYYAYSAINNNKYTAFGWGDMYKERDYILYSKREIEKYTNNKDCSVFYDAFSYLNVTEVITTGDDCSYMVDSCGLVEKNSKGRVCLLQITEESL